MRNVTTCIDKQKEQVCLQLVTGGPRKGSIGGQYAWVPVFPENGIWRFSKDFLVETRNVVKVCKSLLHFLIVKHSLATSGKRMLTALLKWNC